MSCYSILFAVKGEKEFAVVLVRVKMLDMKKASHVVRFDYEK
jgi:hypothetical protein